MAQSKRREPSPVRAGFYHGFLSLVVFGGTLVLAGGAIHLTGDPAAAGPSRVVALFEKNPDATRTARAELVNQSGSLPAVAAASLAERAQSDTTARTPNLGVSDPSGAQLASVAPTRQGSAGSAVVEPRPQGMTINGVFVPVGKSYRQVEENSDTSPIALLDNADAKPEAAEQAGSSAPKISAVTISTPSDANARAFANPENKPIVALIVGGLGTSARQTNAAIDDLPPEVTLSFIADASPRLIRRAREKGHEVLLEVPMEAYTRGRTLPHTQTLLASGSAEDNRQRLDRLLSRGTQFYGVINHNGEKFADADGALEPVLARLQERGLAFFRHGSTPSKSFDKAAGQKDVIYAAANENIDTQVEAEAIERRLQQLEARARSEGAALGTGFAYPLTIDIIVEWTRRLEAKGILLAPASAVPSAATRPIQTSQLGGTTASDGAR